MSEIWDDRKKALEEDYFRRKEREAIERLREKAAAEQNPAKALQCPKCDGTLSEITFEDVQVDRCNQCQGVWLDAGEIERLTKREEGGWLHRMLKDLSGE